MIDIGDGAQINSNAFIKSKGPGIGLEETDAAAREVLMLPLFADLSTDQQDYVLERLPTHAVSLAS